MGISTGSLKTNSNFNRVLTIQWGFQENPYNSIGMVSIVSLKFNSDFNRVLNCVGDDGQARFNFPHPGALDGVHSRSKPIMRMDSMSFAYPTDAKEQLILRDVTVRLTQVIPSPQPPLAPINKCAIFAYWVNISLSDNILLGIELMAVSTQNQCENFEYFVAQIYVKKQGFP